MTSTNTQQGKPANASLLYDQQVDQILQNESAAFQVARTAASWRPAVPKVSAVDFPKCVAAHELITALEGITCPYICAPLCVPCFLSYSANYFLASEFDFFQDQCIRALLTAQMHGCHGTASPSLTPSWGYSATNSRWRTILDPWRGDSELTILCSKIHERCLATIESSQSEYGLRQRDVGTNRAH